MPPLAYLPGRNQYAPPYCNGTNIKCSAKKVKPPVFPPVFPAVSWGVATMMRVTALDNRRASERIKKSNQRLKAFAAGEQAELLQLEWHGEQMGVEGGKGGAGVLGADVVAE